MKEENSMKITTKLALKYINKNKKRSISCITRHNTCISFNNFSTYSTFQLPTIFNEYYKNGQKP